MDNQIFVYIAKANVSILLFAIIYFLLYQKDTHFFIRRMYLLLIFAVSLLFQFIPSFWGDADSGIDISQLLVSQNLIVSSDAINELPEIADNSIYETILIAIWSIVATVMAIKLIVGFVFIVKIKLKSEKYYYSNKKFYFVNSNVTPFSFFRWIFLPSNEFDSKSDILIHEQSHSNGFHSFDLIVSEIFVLLFWYNPAVWYIRKKVRDNLEYLADREVVLSGRDKKEYQYGLLRLYYKADNRVATYFNNSNLKNRIIMMNKQKKSKFTILKYGLLPVALFLLTLTNEAKSNNVEQNDVNTSSYKASISYQDDKKSPLVLIDGVESSSEILNAIDKNNIQSISVLKDETATKEYGEKGKNGVILVSLKNKKTEAELTYNTQEPVKVIGCGTVAKSDAENKPLVIVDGKETDYSSLNSIDPQTIESISVMKDETATKEYGEKGKDGVIIVKLKK